MSGLGYIPLSFLSEKSVCITIIVKLVFSEMLIDNN